MKAITCLRRRSWSHSFFSVLFSAFLLLLPRAVNGIDKTRKHRERPLAWRESRSGGGGLGLVSAPPRRVVLFSHRRSASRAGQRSAGGWLREWLPGAASGGISSGDPRRDLRALAAARLWRASRRCMRASRRRSGGRGAGWIWSLFASCCFVSAKPAHKPAEPANR